MSEANVVDILIMLKARDEASAVLRGVDRNLASILSPPRPTAAHKSKKALARPSKETNHQGADQADSHVNCGHTKNALEQWAEAFLEWHRLAKLPVPTGKASVLRASVPPSTVVSRVQH